MGPTSWDPKKKLTATGDMFARIIALFRKTKDIINFYKDMKAVDWVNVNLLTEILNHYNLRE